MASSEVSFYLAKKCLRNILEVFESKIVRKISPNMENNL